MSALLTVFLCTQAIAASPEVAVVTRPEAIKEAIAAEQGKVVVLKFWATWCAACVEEFSEFLRVVGAFSADDVAVVSVSADGKRTIDKRVLPFLRAKEMPYRTLLLDVGDP